MDNLELLELWKYSEPTYENFIGFVEEYLAPSMKMPFVKEDYYEILWRDMWLNQKVIEHISRGHSKTEFGIWVTIYIAVFQPNNPFYEKMFKQRKRIYEQLVFSSDGTVTGELRDRMDDYFKGNDILSTFVPANAADEKWNTDKFELNNKSIIFFRGMKMKRGLHIDRAWGDDLTSESSTLTDTETWSFFTGAFLPMTTGKQAMVCITGTPIRATDINSRLMYADEGQSWHKIKLPAILNKEENILLSPNRFTIEMLDNIKRDIGTVKFEAEYMLNPIDDTVSLIKREWIEGCRDVSHKIYSHRSYFESLYLGVDFAFSDKATADHSVFFVLGTHNDKFYMLDYIRRKGMSGTEQLQFVRELHSIYRFDMIGFEENSIKAILREVKDLRLPIKLFRTGTVDEKDKKKPDFSHTISVSKRNLILRIGTTFENKQIVLPYNDSEAKVKTDLLVEEAISWAQDNGKLVELGRHPDIPIALGYALEVATKNSFAFDFAEIL